MIDKNLDLYDDPDGSVLKDAVSSLSDIPDFVKEAERLTEVEINKLPDDVFALVALDSGEKMRKFACVDKGNTALSVLYFLENGHKLPSEAQKTAAANLMTACGWYGLEPPDLLDKVARSKNVIRQLQALRRNRSAGHNARAYAIGTLGAKRSGRDAAANLSFSKAVALPSSTASEARKAYQHSRHVGGVDKKIKGQALRKLQEKTAGPITDRIRKLLLRAGPKARPRDLQRGGLTPILRKQAEAEKVALVGAAMGALTMAQGIGQGNKDFKARQKAMQAGMPAGQAFKIKSSELTGSSVMPYGTKTKQASLQPYVDVTGQSAPRPIERETGDHFAMTKEGSGQYPIDTADQVQRACSYFAKHASAFEPFERRTYCRNVNLRAQDLGLGVPEQIAKYGSATMAKDAGVQIYRRQRHFRSGTSEHSLLEEMREKCASIRPEVMAVALERFDRESGLDKLWDNGLDDPYFSMFGIDKIAEWSFVDGNDTLTEERLKLCAKKCKDQIKDLFDEDVADEFAKNPQQIFDSLPLDSKRIIMRVGQQVEE